MKKRHREPHPHASGLPPTMQRPLSHDCVTQIFLSEACRSQPQERETQKHHSSRSSSPRFPHGLFLQAAQPRRQRDGQPHPQPCHRWLRPSAAVKGLLRKSRKAGHTYPKEEGSNEISQAAKIPSPRKIKQCV